MKYYAKIKLIGEDGTKVKIKGEMVSVSFVNEDIEKVDADGATVFHESTGWQTVTIVVERKVEVVK